MSQHIDDPNDHHDLDDAIDALTRKYVRGLATGSVSFIDFKALEALHSARELIRDRSLARQIVLVRRAS